MLMDSGVLTDGFNMSAKLLSVVCVGLVSLTASQGQQVWQQPLSQGCLPPNLGTLLLSMLPSTQVIDPPPPNVSNGYYGSLPSCYSPQQPPAPVTCYTSQSQPQQLSAPTCYSSQSQPQQPPTCYSSQPQPQQPSTSTCYCSQPQQQPPSTAPCYTTQPQPQQPPTPTCYSSQPQPQQPSTPTCYYSQPQQPSTPTCYSSQPQQPSTPTCYSSQPQLPYSSQPQQPSTSTCYSSQPQQPSTPTCYSSQPQPQQPSTPSCNTGGYGAQSTPQASGSYSLPDANSADYLSPLPPIRQPDYTANTIVRTVGLPLPPLPPTRVVSNTCDCTKTVVRSQAYQRLVKVPTITKYIKQSYVPVVQKLNYDAQGYTGPENTNGCSQGQTNSIADPEPCEFQ